MKPTNGSGSPRPQWRARLWRFSRATLGVTAAAVALAIVAPWVGSFCVRLPEELLHPVDRTLTLLDRHGQEIAVVPTSRARVAEALPLEEMGRWLPSVTVALEDRRFWEHNGIDLLATAGAAWRNVRSARVLSGASTIAQQLIKNTRGRRGSRWWNKLAEALAAQRLTREWPRERILAEYLNRIDYGNRRIGPRAAARAYFSKEPRDLTLAEAIFLAGLPQAPTRLNPWSRPERADARYQLCVRIVAASGVIEPATARELAAAPPPRLRRIPPGEAPHFVEMVRGAQPILRGRVRTTLDLELQRTIAALAREHVDRLAGRAVSQAAVVVLDNRDGAVRALIGSARFVEAGGQFNGALLPRSCGSVLKPFLYLEAIEQRKLTAASLLPDTPDALRTAYADYQPQNFDRRFLGPVRLREALGSSLNVPAVYALSEVGARPFFSRLHEWGFRFPRDLRDYGAGMILGHAEVRLLDLAAAFAGLASGGGVPTPRLVESEPILGRRAASPEACAIISDVLCDDEARRHAFGRDSALALPVRVPCKTGTSSRFRDAWTVGSTRQHTVAVWAGNFGGRPMDAATSIEAAAPLWRAIVETLLVRDDGIPQPIESQRLISHEVCRLTGLLPTAESPGVVREWFLAGTEPTESADHRLKSRADGPPTLLLPHEYGAWCRSELNVTGAVAEPPAGIVVRTPSESARFVLDRTLPREQQMLRFEAEAPSHATVTWAVDGNVIDASPDGCFWPLSAGSHSVTASAGSLRTTHHFVVLPAK